MEKAPTCIACDRTSDEIPLIAFVYKNIGYHICPQHLPMLIHKPAQLASKLPGLEAVPGAEH